MLVGWLDLVTYLSRTLGWVSSPSLAFRGFQSRASPVQISHINSHNFLGHVPLSLPNILLTVDQLIDLLKFLFNLSPILFEPVLPP